MKFLYSVVVLATVWVSTLGLAAAEGERDPISPLPVRFGECGILAEGAHCKNNYCCSKTGYCGVTEEWCAAENCAMDCWPPRGPVSDVIDIYLFDELLKHRNDSACEKPGFYTYDAFVTAASYYPDFGSYGSADTRKREIAAFLAQTSHETSGGWDSAPDGRYTWGYCFLTEQNPTDSSYCRQNDNEWPCVPGKSYSGRGPFQLTWNYNYGPCGRDIGYDLLTDPDAVANDAVLSFRSALWFWMTPEAPKPSCHDAITGKWKPTPDDVIYNRLPGYGVTTNIIDGVLECGQGDNETNTQQVDRIGFYEKYCDAFNVTYGDNVDCYNQKPFDSGLGLDQDI